MADLSKVETRTTAQNRITNNRDSILPSRRDTEAPKRQVFNDVRNGSRGDGGVGELRRALGLVQGAANDFQSYADKKFADTEDKLGSQGAFDEAAGHADPELVRKSLAYRNSVYTQRAQTAFYQNSEKLDDQIKGIINSDDPKLADPAVRSHAIEQAIDSNYQQFAIDPETGKLRDWGAPGAAKWLGTMMGQTRAEVRAKALQLVEEKSNTDSINKAAEAFGASIDAGKPMSFEDAMSTLLPTVDRKEAKKTLILTAKDRASSLTEKAAELDDTDPDKARELRVQALGIVDMLRGSKRIVPGAKPADGEAPLGDGSAYYGHAAAPATSLDPKTFFAAFTVKHEGTSYVTDSNGRGVKFGINEQYNPGVDVKNLTQDKAAAIFEKRYWKRSGADKLPPALAAVHADTFYLNEKEAGRILKESGGSVSKYIALRQAFLQGLVNKNPGKYGKYEKGWARRTADLADYAATLEGASPAGPAVSPDVLNPKTPSELAAADPTGASNPAYSLTPEERADLGAFRRQLSADIDRADAAALDKRQSTAALGLMARLHGMGSYPTPGEIQEAARKGDISVSHAVQLLGVIEQDQHELAAQGREARADERAQRQDEREAKADSIDTYANGILGKLVSGKYKHGAQDANAELLKLLPTIKDKDVRLAVFSQVSQGIGAQVELRNATPQYRRAMKTFGELESRMTVALEQRGVFIPKAYRGRAKLVVQGWVDDWRVHVAQNAAVSPDKIDSYVAEARKNLAERFRHTFTKNGTSPAPMRGAGR